MSTKRASNRQTPKWKNSAYAGTRLIRTGTTLSNLVLKVFLSQLRTDYCSGSPKRRAGTFVFDLNVPEAGSNLNGFSLRHDNAPQFVTFKNHRIADLSRFLFASHFLRRRLGCYWSNWSVHDPEAHCFKLEGPTTIRLSSGTNSSTWRRPRQRYSGFR